jgi:hypothetical protein
MLFSVVLRCVIWQILADVSKMFTASSTMAVALVTGLRWVRIGCWGAYLYLPYCFESLRLVCSSSHELLILGISVRIIYCSGFPLPSAWSYFRHTVGLLWTSDQPVSETSTFTGQHNIETQETNIHALSGIRNRDPSNQTAADLRLRRRGYRGRQFVPERVKVTER